MKTLFVFLLVAVSYGQTIIVSTTTSTTASSSNGGTCSILNKTPGSSSFSWSCGPSANEPADQSGNATVQAGQQQVMLWIEADLICVVLVNATANPWAALPNAANTSTITVPANQVGMSCSSKSTAVPATPATIALIQ